MRRYRTTDRHRHVQPVCCGRVLCCGQRGGDVERTGLVGLARVGTRGAREDLLELARCQVIVATQQERDGSGDHRGSHRRATQADVTIRGHALGKFSRQCRALIPNARRECAQDLATRRYQVRLGKAVLGHAAAADRAKVVVRWRGGPVIVEAADGDDERIVARRVPYRVLIRAEVAGRGDNGHALSHRRSTAASTGLVA